MGLKVGDELYFEPSERRSYLSAKMVTVTSVGRKWAGISNGLRIDKYTLHADPGKYNSPGRCYVDREARLAEVASINAWQRMRSDFPSHPIKPGLTAEQIAQAREILGF